MSPPALDCAGLAIKTKQLLLTDISVSEGWEKMRDAGRFHAREGRNDIGQMSAIDTNEEWKRVCSRLRVDLGPETFEAWFGNVRLHKLVHGCAILSVPSKFRRDWIVAHYEDRLRFFWGLVNPLVSTIKFVIDGELDAKKNNAQSNCAKSMVSAIEGDRLAERTPWKKPANRVSEFAAPSSTAERKRAPTPSPQSFSFNDSGDVTLGTPLNPRCTFESFVTGSSNEWAFAAAKQVACTAAEVAFNPLYIYGDVGLGKTHLLQAIAWELRQRNSKCKILYLSAEHFMYQFVRALKGKDMMAFKRTLRTVDVLLLDDIHFIANKTSTQEEFFHTFDALNGRNRQIVVSAKVPPSELCGVDEPIRSRLEQGLSVVIKPTDYNLRLGILKQKVKQVQGESQYPIDIPNQVIQFLARHCDDNVRLLEGALNRLVAQTILVRRPISLSMTKEVLSDLLRTSERRITIDEIQRCVADHFQLRVADLLSKRRPREIVRPRQIAMYLCKHLTTRSLPEIGRKFGNRDHTTVLHSVRKIGELRQNDKRVDDDVDELSRRLAA